MKKDSHSIYKNPILSDSEIQEIDDYMKSYLGLEYTPDIFVYPAEDMNDDKLPAWMKPILNKSQTLSDIPKTENNKENDNDQKNSPSDGFVCVLPPQPPFDRLPAWMEPESLMNQHDS